MRRWRRPRRLDGDSGQSTTEYALVFAAFLAMVGALGLLWHAASGGTLLEIAIRAASHSFSDGSGVGSWQDILMF